MEELAISRALWVVLFVTIQAPETFRLFRLSSKEKDVYALALAREQLGKVFYVIVAACTFLITQINGEFVIFGVNAAWYYASAELVFVIPTIRRRLGI